MAPHDPKSAELVQALIIDRDMTPRLFFYVDRWMLSPDQPQDLATILSATGMTIDPDFMQGQVWKILSGGGYSKPYRTFIDEMWAAYRNNSPDTTPPAPPQKLRLWVTP